MSKLVNLEHVDNQEMQANDEEHYEVQHKDLYANKNSSKTEIFQGISLIDDTQW